MILLGARSRVASVTAVPELDQEKVIHIQRNVHSESDTDVDIEADSSDDMEANILMPATKQSTDVTLPSNKQSIDVILPSNKQSIDVILPSIKQSTDVILPSIKQSTDVILPSIKQSTHVILPSMQESTDPVPCIHNDSNPAHGETEQKYMDSYVAKFLSGDNYEETAYGIVIRNSLVPGNDYINDPHPGSDHTTTTNAISSDSFNQSEVKKDICPVDVISEVISLHKQVKTVSETVTESLNETVNDSLTPESGDQDLAHSIITLSCDTTSMLSPGNSCHGDGESMNATTGSSDGISMLDAETKASVVSCTEVPSDCVICDNTDTENIQDDNTDHVTYTASSEEDSDVHSDGMTSQI